MADFKVTIADADIPAFQAALDKIESTDPTLTQLDQQVTQQAATLIPPPVTSLTISDSFTETTTTTTKMGNKTTTTQVIGADVVTVTGDQSAAISGTFAQVVFDGADAPISLAVISAEYDADSDLTIIRFAVGAFSGQTVDAVTILNNLGQPVIEVDAPGLMQSTLTAIKTAFASVVSFFSGS